MSGNMNVHDHYLHGGVPVEIAENFQHFFPEHEDLTYEEVLLQQESVYLSFQENGKNRVMSTDDASSSSRSQLPEEQGESSRHGSATSQEALDEALARSLQELEDDFDDFFVSEHSHSDIRESPITAPAREVGQDDIDPDNMTFEELLRLRETVGVENKGLPEDLISRLPTSKYKAGMFSKKKETEACVVCQMEYSGGERLTSLPCGHQYHSQCITEWLKLSKNCPVCQKEVKLD